jgi:hypothetical protein
VALNFQEEDFMRLVKVLSLTALVAVVALLGMEAGVASAHSFRADSKVTMRYNADKERFQGHVISRRAACVGFRRVVIHRATPGDDPAVGEVRSNREGFWKAGEAVNPQGDFYARVVRRVRTRDDHSHVCRADVSRTISLGAARRDVP